MTQILAEGRADGGTEIVTWQTTREALALLIETFNAARPRKGNYVVRLEADEYEPGKMTLTGYLDSPEGDS
jgi:hypothetical protein